MGVLATALVAFPASADAPPDQYERFDGDSQSIKDNFTRLEWGRRSVYANVSFGAAQADCEFAFSFGPVGRLPTLKELLTIFDEEPHTEYEFGALVVKHIDAVAFADTPATLPYWSSTPVTSETVWALSFANGRMEPVATGAGGRGNARCVR